jgi:hypothetical protein
MTPIRANIVGPLCSATKISGLYCRLPFEDLVDRVKPTVVGVRAKVEQDADEEERSLGGGAPRIVPIYPRALPVSGASYKYISHRP